MRDIHPIFRMPTHIQAFAENIADNLNTHDVERLKENGLSRHMRRNMQHKIRRGKLNMTDIPLWLFAPKTT